MPREGTKAAEIMLLYAKGLSTKQIGELVGCRPEYVRVVARQRKGRGVSENDKRYLASPRGQEYVRRELEKRRPGRNAYSTTLYWTGSHEAARRAYKRAQEAADA